MENIRLYHTGYMEIRNPDVHYGRRNADFGQGFYLTRNREFSMRWARERRGSGTYLNCYGLDPDGLNIYCFNERNEAWRSYIFDNRAGKDDRLPDADIIIGPIANDTIYNTFGIMTSGQLDKEQALSLLQEGPCYEQVVLKTTKAAGQLRWLSSELLAPERIHAFRELVRQEELAYQQSISRVLESI